MFILGEVCFRQGELHQAAQLYRQVLTAAGEVEVGEPLEDRSEALTRLAALAYEWNELERAEQNASQALELGQRLAVEDLLVHSSLVLARVQHARGETAQAQQRLHSLVNQTKRPLLLREVRASQAQLALAAGDMAAVQRWAATCARPGAEVPFIQQEREALILARMPNGLARTPYVIAMRPSLSRTMAEGFPSPQSGAGVLRSTRRE
jgi:LuxR family maltose regulon positive regulatory protein